MGTIEWEWKIGYKLINSQEKLVLNGFHMRILKNDDERFQYGGFT